MRVLELFSGIGGMHFALEESGIPFEVVAAADINTVANAVYLANFPSVKLVQKNIQSFNESFIDKLAPDMILMSPPCQPFTRVGLKKDSSDNRSNALNHLTGLLPKLGPSLKYILLENVRGFEVSQCQEEFVKALENASFTYQEFLLSPIQFSIPNSRERYYLIAKRLPPAFSFPKSQEIMTTLPSNILSAITLKDMHIEDLLELGDDSPDYDKYLLDDVTLRRRVWILDIVTKGSKRSCCFTKAYCHYVEGTGSFYCPLTEEETHIVIQEAKSFPANSEEFLLKLKELRLRFFTPREVARVLCFPESFSLPKSLTRKQCYRLLGNSINVRVVSYLIRTLAS